MFTFAPELTALKRRCRVCKEVKFLEDFGTNSRMSEGRDTRCKICSTRYWKKYRNKQKAKKRYHESKYVTSSEVKTKKCYECGEVKSLNQYHINKVCADGLNKRCKSCRKEKAKIHYKSRKAKMTYFEVPYKEELSQLEQLKEMREHLDFAIKVLEEK